MTNDTRKRHLRIGLDSYRGRYLWLVASLSALLVAAALVGHTLVSNATERSTGKATHNARLIALLGDTTDALHHLSRQLMQFSIDPTYTDAQTVRDASSDMQLTLDRLLGELHGADAPALLGVPESLAADAATLNENVEQLLQTRLSTEDWIPANKTITQAMYPASRAVMTHLQNLQAMLEGLPASQGAQLKLNQVNIAWLRLLGETRLMVANRFGAFDADSLAGMQSRTADMENYAAHTRALLQALPGELARLEGELLLDEFHLLSAAFNDWIAASQRLRVLLDHPDWRSDIQLLHTSIDPAMQRMRQRLLTVRQQVQTETGQQLERLLDNSAILASAVSLLAAGMIILFLLGYLAFQYWLLRPIQHIAEQLKREALGTATEPLNLATVKETRALVEAFAHMHEQVRARQQRLDYMAHHDPLTGLPNRVMFRERLERSLQQLQPEGAGIALLFLDLDRFKQINDSHGHLVGDQLLVQVARRLRSVFRSEDTVARLSGDEFAVLLHDFSDQGELANLAQKVVNTLQPPFVIEGKTYHSSASIGLTVAPQDGSDADQLIQHADAAMYHAKASGRSGYCHFTRDMIEQSTAQLTLETELHAAVEQQQLELYLQPVVELDTLQTHAFECLLRWRHPQRGMVAPSDFLPTLEDIGLLQSITDWTLDQLGQAGITREHTVSVNLPAKLLHNGSFADSLQQRLQSGDIVPQHLIIEITEDSFSVDLAEAAQLLQRLQALGVRIALDDFGTGQSSLSHLRAFPFDLVKIDRSFVRNIIEDEQDATLVRAIIVLARTLGIEVVGEGVESERQRQFLHREGCRYGQGYLFGTPVPMDSLLSAEQV